MNNTGGIKLNMYYQNTQGLRSSTNRFFLSSSNCIFDIILLCETWLLPRVESSELFDDSFNVFRLDRSVCNSEKTNGGGVLIAVRTNYDSDTIEVPDSETIECISVRVKLSGSFLYCHCAYVPPRSPIETYQLHIKSIEYIAGLLRPTDRIIICGDFNLPDVSWCPSDTNQATFLPTNVRADDESLVCDTMLGLGLSQVNGIHNSRGVFLDLVFCSDSDNTSVRESIGPLLREYEYHKPIDIILDCSIECESPPIGNETFNFRKTDFRLLSAFLARVDWDGVFAHCRSVDRMIDSFYTLLYTGFELFVPKRTVTSRTGHPPWYNSKLLNLRNRKNRAFKQYSTTGQVQYHLKYRRLRSEFDRCQRRLYDAYMRRIQSNIRNDPRSFFSYVDQRRKTSGYPQQMSFNGVSSSNTADTCNLFAQFFKSVYVPCPDLNLNDGLGGAHELGSITLTCNDVLNGLLKLRNKWTIGPDVVPPIVLKRCAGSICKPLLRIFRDSLRSGIFPSHWKISKITPIFKSGSRRQVENYRGIAILPAVGKLFESIVARIVRARLFDVITPNQHGFMAGRSTTTNLLEFTSYALKVIEAKSQLDVVYTDFSKAFDRVPLDILVNKLSGLGVHHTLLSWIKSYLYGRVQYVQIGDACSNEFHATSGVPQGSHLGPFLFILFINDIPDCFMHSKSLLYADDQKGFHKIDNNEDAIVFQNDLNNLQRWCEINRLPLNVEKCYCTTFTRKKEPIIFDYSIGGRILNRKCEVKDLGVTFGAKLDFNTHIDLITSRAYSMFGFMIRACVDMDDLNAFRTIYCSLIRSILEYCSPVWSPWYQVHIDRIESMQRKFVRYAYRKVTHQRFVHYLDYPTYLDGCVGCDLDTLEHRRFVLSMMFLFDLMNGRVCSEDLLLRVRPNEPTRMNLRNRPPLRIDRHQTNYGRNEPITRMCKCFNDLANLMQPGTGRSAFRSICLNSPPPNILAIRDRSWRQQGRD